MLRPLRFARWDMYFTFRDIVAHADRRLVAIVLKAKSKYCSQRDPRKSRSAKCATRWAFAACASTAPTIIAATG
jgi:hypothetical protein